VQIPTNKPIAREDLPDRVYQTIEQKYTAVAKKVKELHQKGQPVLIGTTSILQSEKVAQFLKKEKLSFELLNAKTIEQEIQLISLAGQKGRITVATNMVGRGTDIMLGEGVAELGGLYVIGTERHESRRIDNQLKGRSGRQGDPGKTEFYISIEDDMIRRFAHEEIEKLKRSLKADEDGMILNKNIHDFVDRIQRICEGANFSIREYNLKLDDVLNVQRNTVYDLRNKILESENLIPLLKSSIESYRDQEIEKCCPEDADLASWKLDKLEERINLILPTEKVHLPLDLDHKQEINQIINEKLGEYLPLLDQYEENGDVMAVIQRFLLSITDHHWLRHIDAMDRLKEGVGLRSYSQEDPMRQYAREGLELFTQMFYELERDVSRQTANFVRTLLAKDINA